MSHVVFRKQVSDGNYGTEAAEVALDLPDDWIDSAIALALQGARELVEAELRRSPNVSVRRAVEYPKPAAVDTGDNADPEDLPF